MSTLTLLAGDCYYVPGSVNAGVVLNPEGDAILIDSGGDKNYGRTIRKALEAVGRRPVALINTHSHADHYGGNDYLARNLDLPVWAPEVEEAILRYPYLEPMYLYGGASPLAGLRNKWLEAKPSSVDHVYEVVDGPLEVAGVTLERVVTSGHAVRQVALGVGEVCYAADTFFGAEVLDKYEIPFVHDVAGQIESLERLPTLPYDIFLPGHGEPTRDIEAAVAANRAAIDQTTDWVLRAVAQPATTSEVVHDVTSQLDTPPTTLATYFLMQSCVLAYLSWLTTLGEIEPIVDEGILHWHSR